MRCSLGVRRENAVLDTTFALKNCAILSIEKPLDWANPKTNPFNSLSISAPFSPSTESRL